MPSPANLRLPWQCVAKVRDTRGQSIGRIGTSTAIVEQVHQEWVAMVHRGRNRHVSPRFAFRIKAMAWAEECVRAMIW